MCLCDDKMSDSDKRAENALRQREQVAAQVAAHVIDVVKDDDEALNSLLDDTDDEQAPLIITKKPKAAKKSGNDVEADALAPLLNDPQAATRRTIVTSAEFWRSRNKAVFIMQAVISLLVLLFCCTQLIIQEHSCETTTYLSIIMATTAYWLPQPRL